MTNRSESQRMNFDAECGDVLLLEFTRQVALDEGGLRRTVSISSVQGFIAD